MATDEPDKDRLAGFTVTGDYLHEDEDDDDEFNDNNQIELQHTLSQDEQSDDRLPQEILYDDLKSLIIEEDDDDHIDFLHVFIANNIDPDITNIILHNEEFMNIEDFLSWQDLLTVKGVTQLMNSKPPDFVAPTSLELETIEANEEMSNNSLMNSNNNSGRTLPLQTTSTTIDTTPGPSTGATDEEKYPFNARNSRNNDIDFSMRNTEYACKRCARPVRNNVFMEQTVEECTSQEINFEVERLICCLHFLAEEFDIYHSLKGYLKAIETESKAANENVSSPYSINRKQSDLSSRTPSLDVQKEEVLFMVKRSDTSHHIQWLHMAYVREKTERLTSQKKLNINLKSSKPPDWHKTIQKKRLAPMYEHLKNVFNETITDLSEPFLKANAEKYGLTDEHGAYDKDKKLVEDLKRRLRQRELGQIGDLAVNNLSVESDEAIIKKMSTYSMTEEMNKYEGNETKYDPLYSSTPTDDEMICYDSVCQVIFNENVSSNHFENIADVQKIKKAFELLRSQDAAVALSNAGWVTTIDNILCVLLYRDIQWYRANFIGELRISLVIEGMKGTSVEHYESAAVLRAIKQSVLYAYIGIPKIAEAVDNAFAIENILLRDKKTEQANLCSCTGCAVCETNHLVRLTFGIRCDDTRCDVSNVLDIYKFNKQFPYKFLYQAKRLFEQIYRNKFNRLFDASARKIGAQIKLYEIHSYDLNVYEYPRTEIDAQLTQQYALPSSSANPLDSNEIMNLQNNESLRYAMTPATPYNNNTDYPVYGALGAGPLRTQRANTVDNYFVNSFNTSNMQQFGDTIIEDDYGVSLETRIVNGLNKIINWINPRVIYKKIRLKQKKEENKEPLLVDIPDALQPSEMKSDQSLEDNEIYQENKGHRICCGHCNLTCGMFIIAIMMAVVVAIGGYNIWTIGKAPMKPTMENILSFTERMIATEAEYVAERALFSTQQFIDFTKVVPGVTDSKSNTQIFDTFLNDELISTPRFDGVFLVKHNITNNETIANFIFKRSDNRKRVYDCNLDDITALHCDNEDLFMISNKLWSHKIMALQDEVTETYFLAHSIINSSSSGACMWFVTWRYIEPKSLIIGGLFFGSRINEEYLTLTLAKKGVVYWMTNDEHRDVFVTSINDPDTTLYIASHDASSSSINLDTSFGHTQNTAEYDASEVDVHILNTRSNVNIEAALDIDYSQMNTDEYYIYYRLQNSTFGSFYVVIVFPRETVFAQLKKCYYIVIICTIIAMVCAVINACIANAVPLIPADDSWLAIPLFTDQDKKELQEAAAEQNAFLKSPERRPIDADKQMNAMPHLTDTVMLPPPNKVGKKKLHKTKSQQIVSQHTLDMNKTESAMMDTVLSGPRTLPTEELFLAEEIELGASTNGAPAKGALGRMRSQSDERDTNHYKSVASLADAKEKMKALANADVHEIGSMPLKSGTRLHANTILGLDVKEDPDTDDDEEPPPFMKAVSVATGLKPVYVARMDKQRRVDKKKRRDKIQLLQKKKQSDQLQKNINNATMRSIFSREESKYKTTYAQHVSRGITCCCFLIAGFIGLAYLALRSISGSDIEELMESHLNISNSIVEAHAEFKVYQHGLALQQGQLLIKEYEIAPYDETHNEQLLSEFYNVFDELSGIFTFVGTNKVNNLSIYGSTNDGECVHSRNIHTSYLAECISWEGCEGNKTYESITDCTLYRAIAETYAFFLNISIDDQSSYINFISWSLPFPCFGGSRICYVGLTRARDNVNSAMYIGALLSMHGLADTAENVVWKSSGMQQIVTKRENETRTGYIGDQVHFSFYLFTQIYEQLAANQYGIEADLLLAATDNDVITTTQTAYGVTLASVLLANESSNNNVQSTYNYLYETNQTAIRNIKGEATMAWSSWGYPKIVYFWFENDDGLNWISVITISQEIFLGDHNAYSTLGSISLIGWIIIYLFMHFISYRRFEENIEYWEHLYLRQIERDTFPLFEQLEHQLQDEDEEEAVKEENNPPQEDDDVLQAQQQAEKQLQAYKASLFNMNEEEEQLTLDFISANIRDTVRLSCKQSWIRQQQATKGMDFGDLPTRRSDITDHYHARALKHIYQAKRGMNIITVVQMEQYGQKNEYKLRLYTLQTSRPWRYFMQLLMMLHLSLVWWRPLTTERLQDGYPKIPLIIECVCLFFELLDLLLSYFIQFRWQNTSKNPLMSPGEKKGIFIARCLVWLLVVIDVALIVFFAQSFTRVFPLRPLLLVLSNDKLIGACYALVITSLNAADALLLFAMLLGIAAVSGLILFRFEELMDHYNVYSFQNIVRSIWTTYIFIISGENYGELVYISFETNPGFIIYFIILTVLGSWIVVSLVVSRFQTSFKEIYTKERERRIYFKRTGYVAAFSLINLDDDNEVSKAEFGSFVSFVNMKTKLGNNSDEEHIQQLRNLDYDAFDVDGDGSIDIREFVIKLEEIYQKPVLIDIINDDDSLLSWIRLNIVETEAFSQFVLVIILIELILFSLFGIYPGTQNTEMLDVVLGITVLLNGLDIAVKIVSMGWDYYWNTSKCRIINRHKTNVKQVALKKKKEHEQQLQQVQHEQRTTLEPDAIQNTLAAIGNMQQLIEEQSIMVDEELEDDLDAAQNNADKEEGIEYEVSVYTQDPLHLKEREFAHRFDLVIVSCAIILFVITRVSVQQLWFSDKNNTLRVVMVIPLLRLLTLIKTTRSAVYIITRVIPRFTSLVMILVLLFYMYAVIGVWLIGDQLKKLLNEPQYSFETFTGSLVTLFQLTVGEGWHDVMYATVYATNSLLTTTWYFVTFVLIITLIFTNLFVGLVISVVDDVETDNKVKYGQLRLEYQQEQVEQKLKDQQKREKKAKKTSDNEHGGNDYNDQLQSDEDDSNFPRNPSLPSDHHSHRPITPLMPHNAKSGHRPQIPGSGLSRNFMSQRAIGRTQKSQFHI